MYRVSNTGGCWPVFFNVANLFGVDLSVLLEENEASLKSFANCGRMC